MSAPIVWRWLGRCAYELALVQQEVLWRARCAGGPDACLALEHPPTVTLGKRATHAALRVSAASLMARDVACVAVERGGHATYHGPGQLVLYPIVALAARGFGVASFVWTLEEIMIALAAHFGVVARRDQRGHGVWTTRGKLGAVGIRVRDGVSQHGLAFNVSTDLSGFDLINPCGIPGMPVTSLRAEGVGDASITRVLRSAEEIACRLLAAPLTTMPLRARDSRAATAALPLETCA